MKKIKLLIALCLSMLCIGAVTANAATMTTTMADEVALFENLGFTLPETAAETDFITRGQFVGTLTQYINTEFAAGGEYSFADVPKDDALSGALNYAVAMGIVSDDDMFYPQNNVTYPQAMKMAVAFLGRSVEAESLGGYDGGGYNAVASTYKLYAGLQDMTGEFVTVRDFYKILYNVGNADMLVRDQYGNMYTGNTPFEEYYNMYHVRGLVTATDDTSLNDNSVVMPTNVIALNEDMYRYDGDVKVGYRMEGWASYESGDMPRIVMIKEYKNTVTEIPLVGLEDRIDGNVYYYEDKGRESKIKLDDPYIIYNGIAAPTMRATDVLNCKLGTLTFIDNDDELGIDVISVSEYRPVVVSITSKTTMRIVDMNGAPAVLLDNDGRVKSYKIVKDGQEIAITDLVKDDLLMVYESKTKSHVYVEVVTNTISGSVTSHNSVERQIKVDDTVYALSDYFNSYYMSRITYNLKTDFAATPDGVIHAITTPKTSANQFGVILKWWNDDNTDDMMIKLATEKDGVITVKKAKNFKLDGQSTTESTLKSRLGLLRGRGMASLFVKYALNADGTEIKVIDTYDQLTSNEAPQNIMTGAEDPDNDLKEYNFPYATTQSPNSGNFFWNADDRGWSPYVDDIKKVFVITTADGIEENEIFTVQSRAYIKEMRDNDTLKRNPTEGGFTARQYRLFNVDRFGNAEAILFVRANVSTTISSDDAKGIVYRISKAANLDGEVTYEVVLYAAGTYKSYFMSEDYYQTLVSSPAGVPFANGDYIAYKTDLKDEIIATEVVYDKSERALVGELTTPNYYSTREAYITGWLYDLDGTKLSLIPSGYFNTRLNADNIETFNPATDALMGMTMGSAPLNIISTDGRTISEGSMGDVTTFLQSPDSPEFVILRLYEGVLQEVILYK